MEIFNKIFNIHNRIVAVLSTIIFGIFNTMPVHAHCPICTAAVGVGLVTTRVYGFDDAIMGVWIGAFIISTAVWANNALKKRFIPFQAPLMSITAFILTTGSFYAAGLMNGTYAKAFGIDRLLLGIIVGSVLTYAMPIVSKKIKELNKNKVLFPFQTIVLIVLVLIIASISMMFVK
ncbi:MAG: hypothetical protein AABW72_04090 [archaeon]